MAADALLGAASTANPLIGLAGAALSAAAGGPSSAQAGSSGNLTGATFDSPWNVTFGDAAGITAPYNKTTSTSLPGAIGNLGQYLPYALLAVGAIVAVRLTRKR